MKGETLEKHQLMDFGYELGDLCLKYGVRFETPPRLIVEDNRQGIIIFRDGCLLRFYDQFACESGVPDRRGQPRKIPPKNLSDDGEYQEEEEDEE